MRQLAFTLAFVFCAAGFAETKSVRWTSFDDKEGSFARVLETLNGKTGFALKDKDFKKMEERDLATSHYVFYAQVGNNVPLRRKSLQLWTERANGQLIQAEATVDTPLAAPQQRDDMPARCRSVFSLPHTHDFPRVFTRPAERTRCIACSPAAAFRPRNRCSVLCILPTGR